MDDRSEGIDSTICRLIVYLDSSLVIHVVPIVEAWVPVPFIWMAFLACLALSAIRERPIIRTDLQIRTTFGFGWVGGFRVTRCSDFQGRKNTYTQKYCFYS